MSVVENPTTEPMSQDPQQKLLYGSVLGAALLLAGLGLIFGGLPYFWGEAWRTLLADGSELQKNLYLRDALLILAELFTSAILTFGAYSAIRTQTTPGVRAGILILAIYAFVVLQLVVWLGWRLDREFDDTLGLVLLGLIYASFLAAAGYVYWMVPGYHAFLVSLEEAGWFHFTSYKGNQGVRVRRGTVIGILAIGLAGIITMVWNRYFGYERLPVGDQAGIPNDWTWLVPFTGGERYIYLMFKLHAVLPIVLFGIVVWIAWRIVNIPVFADFLIATEAEMNKVSWTTRRRLVQDTIVVLTTVIFFTAFLFIVDVIWIHVLSAPGIKVLLINPREEAQKQQEKAQW